MPNGRLVSSFALHLPEYATARFKASGCGAGSSRSTRSRRSVRASATCCGPAAASAQRRPSGRQHRRARDARLPDAAVHLVAEPVPRVAAAESAGPARRRLGAGRRVRGVRLEPGAAVRVRARASGRFPTTSSSAWWSRASRSGRPSNATASRFRVYFLNDRGGIYALGYPVDHVVRPPRQSRRAGGAGGRAVRGAARRRHAVQRVVSSAPASGRALLREVRSSFYRKLFLAFVAGAVVPVFILAVAIAHLLRRAAARRRRGSGGADRDDGAAPGRGLRRAAAARGRRRSARSTIRSWCSSARAIDEDVNLFDRARLQATSARDLFASQLLHDADAGAGLSAPSCSTGCRPSSATKTSARSAIWLAAAPVRAGGREGIVTVPLTLRQQEIEQQIDELDRQVSRPASCCSACSARRSATGWPSGLPIRSTA